MDELKYIEFQKSFDEYCSLVDKENSGSISEHEMKRMKSLMTSLIQQTFELSMINEENTRVLEERINQTEHDIEEIALLSNMRASFIKEKGLETEFSVFVEGAVANAVADVGRPYIKLVQ